ncbi:MAG: redoxin domain-containing protein [Planctomycetia bacterium]|nr:redoxin domain-containing protein [Planctomycetia bacterium]
MFRRQLWAGVAATLAACGSAGGLAGWSAAADGPTVDQALKLRPVQKDVDYDVPPAAAAAKATLKSEKTDLGSAWVVRDQEGQVIRQFIDTNGDGVVDMWCYFEHGVEVYRDVDTNYNGRVDQSRWLNTAGARHGLDANEDGKIDSWKSIGPEEVSQELVAALAARDSSRFARLLLSADEAKALGLGKERQADVLDRIGKAQAGFDALAAKQQGVTAKTEWLQFAALRPGVVPSGTEGSTKDLLVYENVAAIVETEGKPGSVRIGTMVSVGSTWRLIEAPLLDDNQVAEGGYFFRTSAPRPADVAGDTTGGSGSEEKLQKLLTELEALDRATAAAGPAALERNLDRRLDILQQLADAAHEKDKGQWISQLADTLSAASQAGGYTKGIERLKALSEKLEADGAADDVKAYVAFRLITADYTTSLQAPKPDFAKIHMQWLDKLKGFVEQYPKSPDAAEAMLQLAMAEEMAGQDEEAINWYRRVAKDFSGTMVADKSLGAVKRLTSLGKPLSISGTTTTGARMDLSKLKGKVVLVHYWDSTSELCQADLKIIKDLYAKFGREGLVPLGINLDSSEAQFKAYAQQNRISWLQIHDARGIDGPLATDLGVLTLPTMLLLDKSGQVVNRNIHSSELEGEITKYLKAK